MTFFRGGMHFEAAERGEGVCFFVGDGGARGGNSGCGGLDWTGIERIGGAWTGIERIGGACVCFNLIRGTNGLFIGSGTGVYSEMASST